MSTTSWLTAIVGVVLAATVLVAVVAQWRYRAKQHVRTVNGAREQAERWAEIIRGHHSGRGRVAQVKKVYQRALRGTKVILCWYETGRLQDGWFERGRGVDVRPGQWVLLRGSDGFGPHNRTRVHYVRPGDVLARADASAPDAFKFIQYVSTERAQ